MNDAFRSGRCSQQPGRVRSARSRFWSKRRMKAHCYARYKITQGQPQNVCVGSLSSTSSAPLSEARSSAAQRRLLPRSVACLTPRLSRRPSLPRPPALGRSRAWRTSLGSNTAPRRGSRCGLAGGTGAALGLRVRGLLRSGSVISDSSPTQEYTTL